MATRISICAALALAAASCGDDASGGAVDAGGPDADASGVPYDQDGPVPFTVEVEHLMNAGQSFDVTVYMPTSPGAHPVVSFSCGSTQKAAGYAPHATRLASYGIATVVADDPGALTKTIDVVTNAVYVVDTWLPTALAGKVDTAHVGLAGHSRGGAVSLLAAEHGLEGKVVAWFGLDPVDNQFGMDPGAFARADLPKLGIPTTYLGASVTSNCAPAADSYPTLYPLSPAPSVLIVGNGAGHTQLESQDACTACSICKPVGTADPDVVLAYALRYLTAFFARELLGDASVGATFDGAGAPSDVAAGLVTITSK